MDSFGKLGLWGLALVLVLGSVFPELVECKLVVLVSVVVGIPMVCRRIVFLPKPAVSSSFLVIKEFYVLETLSTKKSVSKP